MTQANVFSWSDGDRWGDPRLVWIIAIVAVMMLTGTWLLARRRRGKLNRAAILCAIASVLLHGVLIALLPYASRPGAGNPSVSDQSLPGAAATIRVAAVSDPELSDAASPQPDDAGEAAAPPLPVEPLMLATATTENDPPPSQASAIDSESTPVTPLEVPTSIPAAEVAASAIVDRHLDEWLSDMLAAASEPAPQPTTNARPSSDAEDAPAAGASLPLPAAVETPAATMASAASGNPAPGRVLGSELADFANRQGSARQQAVMATGGDEQTEAAVEAGVLWLSRFQGADGAWDAARSGAGIERSVLGQHRSGAGARATTGISGLALMSMLGAGHTHQAGTHQQSVRSGLQYLLSIQGSDGSMAGGADPYARTYCHGMAALAMCETAAMTGDVVALDSTARAAVSYTVNTQHPTTGGWRYVPGDPGDMSQLGWQAMVLASGQAAGADVPQVVVQRTQTFLRGVRTGRTGGLASYKPGEAASRTMTAEALATRLLLGERVPAAEIAEAQAFLLEELPGTGQDNYYYWYYASLALHQLQDDVWRTWNERMKRRLLSTQLPDGSWPTSTVWGGHGGKVYTTAMACLCLEVYYRHATDSQRRAIATRPEAPGR